MLPDGLHLLAGIADGVATITGRSVDRLAVLGSPVGIFAPRHQKRLTKEKDIRAQGAVLCQKLKAKEVTVDALCGTRAWTMDRIIPATDNLCRKGR